MTGLQKRALCETHLNFILTSIQYIEERNHTNLFEIIEKSGSKFTENDNGVFIRLNQLSLECIWEIYDYIKNIAGGSNLGDEAKPNVKCIQQEKFFARNQNSNCDRFEERMTVGNSEIPEIPIDKETNSKDKTEMFSQNNIEIDSWKKDIIMKLKNKAKK
jgi:hypothetical protein